MKFLFTMVQTLVLYRAMQEGQFLFLKDATDVASFLKNATPLSHDFVDRLYGEYIMVASRQRPFAEAFFEKTRTFLTMFVEVIRNGAPWGELASLNQLENAQKLSVSVIIITRSRCEQLRRCLASLLHLERLPDELIVIDNGSRDATSDVVASFQAPFPVRYFYESTVGVSAARNAGVRAAACDVLAFIDDDAVAEPQWLSAIENAFLRDPRIGIVGGSIKNLRDARDDLLYRYLDLVERM